jgi:hypothetical protein
MHVCAGDQFLEFPAQSKHPGTSCFDDKQVDFVADSQPNDEALWGV